MRELEGAPAVEQNPALDGRCETCGAASPDGGLCPSCQQAFNAWLGNAETSTVSDPTTPKQCSCGKRNGGSQRGAEHPRSGTGRGEPLVAADEFAGSAAGRLDCYMPDPVEKVSERRASTMVADDNMPAPMTEAVKHEAAVQVASAEAMLPEPVNASEPIRLEEEKPLTAASSS